MTLRFAALLVPLLLAGCGATTYSQRPARYDSPANVAAETQRVAQRMGGRAETQVALVDPNAGTVLTAWRMIGLSEEVTIFPPGERRGWHVVRYRAFVRPNGWGTSVFVDLEQFDCDSAGFSWSALELHGSCRPITSMTASQLQALDALAASLRG